MSNKNKLSDFDLENVSGGAWVLPDYMKDMSKEEIGQVLRDPDFVGSPEWNEIMELNRDKVQGKEDELARRAARFGNK
jgi:hypothetical protein